MQISDRCALYQKFSEHIDYDPNTVKRRIKELRCDYVEKQLNSKLRQMRKVVSERSVDIRDDEMRRLFVEAGILIMSIYDSRPEKKVLKPEYFQQMCKKHIVPMFSHLQDDAPNPIGYLTLFKRECPELFAAWK